MAALKALHRGRPVHVLSDIVGAPLEVAVDGVPYAIPTGYVAVRLDDGRVVAALPGEIDFHSASATDAPVVVEDED